MAAPVILIEAKPRRASDGVAVTVRLAGGGGVRPYYYGGQHWRAGIMGLPRSVSKLDFDGEQLGGGGVAQALEFAWSPASRQALAELAMLVWDDAPVTVRIGPEGAGLPPIATSGLCLNAAVQDGALRVALADATVDLLRPLLVDRYAGTGGIEGPVEWTDRIKPRMWGRCFNVLGQLIDQAANIWVFGDPRRPIEAFDDVRARGVSGSPLPTLAWQGSAEATLAALVAIAVPDGTAVACPSIACVKWWTDPAGDIHADIRGETDGGYVETAPAIAARIVAERSTLAFGAGEIAAAVEARPGPYGWRVDSDSATAAEQVSSIFADVSISWPIVDDEIMLRCWDWTPSTRSARSHSVARRSITKPVAARKLGYHRNQAPMQHADIAASVLAGDVVFRDGRTAQELQPAELGADKTANVFAGLDAGRSPQQVLDDLDLGQLNVLANAVQLGQFKVATDQLLYDENGQAIGLTLKAVQAIVNGHETVYAQLVRTDGGVFRVINTINQDGVITGTENLIDGTGRSQYFVMADIFGVVQTVGGQVVKPFVIIDGVAYFDHIKVRQLDTNVAMVPARVSSGTIVAGSYPDTTGFAQPRSAQLMLALPAVTAAGWVEVTVKAVQGVRSDGPWSAIVAMNGVDDQTSIIGNGSALGDGNIFTQAYFYVPAGPGPTITFNWAGYTGLDLRERSMFAKFFPATA